MNGRKKEIQIRKVVRNVHTANAIKCNSPVVEWEIMLQIRNI